MKDTNLYKTLEEVTNNAFMSLLSESEYNNDATLALKIKTTDNEIIIDNYTIEIIKYNIYDTIKYYYNIYDNITNELLYKDICLFITAKTIVNLKLKERSINDYLIILDTKYGSLLNNALFYKSKINGATTKRNTYMAKYDGCMMNLNTIRAQIENFDK